MENVAQKIFAVVLGVALTLMMAQCTKSGSIPFGAEPNIEEGTIPFDKTGVENLAGEAAVEGVPAQKPLVESMPEELTLVSHPASLVSNLPDGSEATVLFCMDGGKVFSSAVWSELVKTPTLTKFVEKMESKAGQNIEGAYLWTFACSPLADKDCGQKLLIVEPLKTVSAEEEAVSLKIPFDTAGLPILSAGGFDSYKKDDVFYAVKNGKMMVSNNEPLMKAALLNDMLSPKIPADSVAVLIAKMPAKVLEKIDFFKPNAANVKPVQKMVAFLKIAPDENPELDIKYYAGDYVAAATVVRLDIELVDWDKLFNFFKSEDSKDTKTEVDSANKPVTNSNSKTE